MFLLFSVIVFCICYLRLTFAICWYFVWFRFWVCASCDFAVVSVFRVRCYLLFVLYVSFGLGILWCCFGVVCAVLLCLWLIRFVLLVCLMMFNLCLCLFCWLLVGTLGFAGFGCLLVCFVYLVFDCLCGLRCLWLFAFCIS